MAHKYHPNTRTTIQIRKEIVKIWKKDNKEVFKYHKQAIKKNKEYYFLRYEDFANKPELYLTEVLSFLGLNFEVEMLDLNRYENHMVCGNASRINAERIHKPFESWKEHLTQEQRDFFNLKAKKLNQKFGYQK